MYIHPIYQPTNPTINTPIHPFIHPLLDRGYGLAMFSSFRTCKIKVTSLQCLFPLFRICCCCTEPRGYHQVKYLGASPTIVHNPKVVILLLFHSQYGWYIGDKKLRYSFQWNSMFQGLKYVYTASRVKKSPEMNVKNNQEGFA